MSYTNRQYSTQLDEHADGRPRWEHAMSQSFVSGMQMCPEQTRAQWAGEVPREYTDSTAQGESMHEGIQYLLSDKRDGLPVDLDTAIQVAVHHLEGLEWKYTKYSKASMFANLPVMLEAYAADILPLVEPRHIELPFKQLLYEGTHRTIYVVGTIDCIDQDGVVWDWKSGSREHEVWEHQRWAVQPTVYTYAQHMHEVGDPAVTMDEKIFRYGVVLPDGSTQQYNVWRDEGHVQWLRQQCSQIAWLIENDVKPWVLNDGGWWCSEKWCPKFAECKGAALHVEWKSRAQ